VTLNFNHVPLRALKNSRRAEATFHRVTVLTVRSVSDGRSVSRIEGCVAIDTLYYYGKRCSDRSSSRSPRAAGHRIQSQAAGRMATARG
jgi:hypothetical protein